MSEVPDDGAGAGPTGGSDPGDDLEPTGGARRAGLLVPVASADVAAALAVARGMTADAVPCPRGVLLVPREPLADGVVGTFSRSVGRHDTFLLSLADEQVSVERWRAGKLVDTPAYGVVGGVGGDAERVLLGRLDPARAQGAVSTEGMDKAAARRTLLAGTEGPVRPAQVALTAVLLVAAVVLFAVNVIGLLEGDAGGGASVWNLLITVLWAVLAIAWGRRLVGQVARMRREPG